MDAPAMVALCVAIDRDTPAAVEEAFAMGRARTYAGSGPAKLRRTAPLHRELAAAAAAWSLCSSRELHLPSASLEKCALMGIVAVR